MLERLSLQLTTGLKSACVYMVLAALMNLQVDLMLVFWCICAGIIVSGFIAE